jgi:hypothetical protein
VGEKVDEDFATDSIQNSGCPAMESGAGCLLAWEEDDDEAEFLHHHQYDLKRHTHTLLLKRHAHTHLIE